MRTFLFSLATLLILALAAGCGGGSGRTDAGDGEDGIDASDGQDGLDAGGDDGGLVDGGDDGGLVDGGDDGGPVDGGDDGGLVDGEDDGGPDGGDDGGGLEDGDGGGDEDGDGGEPDGGGDVDPQMNYDSMHLAGDFNAWAAAAQGYAFAPAADHLWRLEVDLSEGLHQFQLTADGSFAVAFGGQAVAHDHATLVLSQGGGRVDLVCFYAGTYVFSFDDESRQLGIDFPGRPQADPIDLDADPRGIDNRHLGGDLLDALTSDAAVPSPALAEILVSGGTPLRGGQLLHFLALGAEGSSAPVTLAGTFNGWDSTALPMTALAGTRLFYASMPTPSGHVAYKFVEVGNWSSDPLNPNVEWDGIAVAGVGNFNSTLPLSAPGRQDGRLLRFADLPSTTMGDARDVFVYLPVAYDLEPAVARPLMVVHDGNESIVRSQLDAVADSEMAAGRVEPVVMAFVALPSQEQRIDEYTFNTATSRGELYRLYICDELLPFLRGSFHLESDPGRTSVYGASLGGLISYFIGWERPDAFGQVAGMSSSFFWDDNWMVLQVQNDSGPLKALRFYLDSADVNDNHDVTIEMRDALEARGYPVLHVVQAGASHDWVFWKQRFPGMMQYLYPAVR